MTRFFVQSRSIGSCPDLLYGWCHGDDEKAVFAELCDIVEEVIELYKQDGKPLPTLASWKTLVTGITSEGEEVRRNAI